MPNAGKATPCAGGAKKASAEHARFTVEVPLDSVGLYGMAFDSAHVPSHFLAVSLDKVEMDAVFPAFEEMNAIFGVHIDRCEEAIIPSRFAADALKTLRGARNRTEDPSVRNAVEKLLPVFEKAAELRMPIAFWL